MRIIFNFIFGVSMNKTTKHILTTATLLSVFTLTPAMADDHDAEKAEHFAAKPAPDTNTAICNLSEFNAILSEVTSADKMDPVAMVKVHELTYTLENALARLKTTLEETAVALEEVHLASERMDEAVVKAQTKAYLALLATLRTDCHR